MTLRFPEQLLLDSADIAAVAPPLAEIVDMVEDTYRMDGRGEVEVPLKAGVHPDRPHSFLHAMPAWIAGEQALGMKWISYYPGNTERGFPDSSGLIVLNDPEHGLPVAIMEGMWITFVRTAACGAVAARHCARRDPARLGLVGCGGLGKWSLRVLSALFPSLQDVFVASRRRASRERFCAAMAEEGSWTLTPVDSAEHAVRGMDIVVSSIPQGSERPLKAAWWTPGMLAIPLDVVTAWDDEAFEILDLLVADNDAGLRAAAAQRRPDLALPNDFATFGDIVLGNRPGRLDNRDRIMAIPTGLGSVDMPLAWSIYRRAREAGVGKTIDLLSDAPLSGAR